MRRDIGFNTRWPKAYLPEIGQTRFTKEQKEGFRWHSMPYCIEPKIGGAYYIVNRSYIPIGDETYKLKGLTPEIVKELSITNADFYLYDDLTVPTRSAEAMAAYLKRLAILETLGAVFRFPF